MFNYLKQVLLKTLKLNPCFKDKNRGTSVVEGLVAAGILGVSLYIAITLGSTKVEIDAKSNALGGILGLEDAAVSDIELMALDFIHDAATVCGNGSQYFEKKMAKPASGLRFDVVSNSVKSKMPKTIRKQCDDAVSSSAQSFSFCRMLIDSSGAYDFLKKYTVVMRGAYFYKDTPSHKSYKSCSYIKSNVNSRLVLSGADFYYEMIVVKNTELLKEKPKFSSRKRYKYLRLNKTFYDFIKSQ